MVKNHSDSERGNINTDIIKPKHSTNVFISKRSTKDIITKINTDIIKPKQSTISKRSYLPYYVKSSYDIFIIVSSCHYNLHKYFTYLFL